jgi:hypothetical protein
MLLARDLAGFGVEAIDDRARRGRRNKQSSSCADVEVG